MDSARTYYRLHVALASLAGAAVLAGAWVVWQAVGTAPTSPAELAVACRSAFAMVTPGSVLILALSGLAGASVFRAVRSLVGQLRTARRLSRRFRALEQATIDGLAVRVLDDLRPQAFCAGLLRPRVYISSGARAALSGAEIRAVLAHEHHHARQRDPLRLLAAQVASEALFFLPVMRRARSRYADLAEMAADAAAVERAGSPGALAAAMLRFDQIAAPGTVGIAPERVDHLLGAQPRWELSASLIAGAFMAIVGVMVLAVGADAAAPAGGFALSSLLMQACGVTMIGLPLVTAAWVLALARRAGSH